MVGVKDWVSIEAGISVGVHDGMEGVLACKRDINENIDVQCSPGPSTNQSISRSIN